MNLTRLRHHPTPPHRPAVRLLLAAVVGVLGGAPILDASALAAPPGPQRARACDTAAVSPPPATYTVASGDSWFEIAVAAGTTSGALLAANGATVATVLHPGDVLCLPPGVAAPAAPTPPAPPAPAAPACAAMRVIAAGDTWYAISRAARVSLNGLLEANDATATTVLHPGDEICLPPGATVATPEAAAPAAPAATPSAAPACAATHTVVSGDSWFGIAMGAGLRIGALLDANDATAETMLRPGDQVCLPEGAAPATVANPCEVTQTVVAGDSWYAISRATGVPLPALYAANDASDATILHPGVALCVPTVGYAPSRTAGFVQAPPVRGACRFANSWGAPREGGRTHQGLDVIAAEWTPVHAVADGTLTRQLRQGAAVRSGNAWYLTTSNGTYFFYAHLAGFAEGLAVGSRVRAGDVIGYIGATGNAGIPHLHFEIHPYGGAPVNPYESVWLIGGCDFNPRYEQAPW